MPSSSPTTERSKPLLGTFVSVRVQGLEPRVAHAAIDAAFAEIAAIHSLMSFHEPDSDVSRLNRAAHEHAVRVDERTLQVLQSAAEFSARSAGVFDVTIAPSLVAMQLLPDAPRAARPDAAATWQDIVLEKDGTVRFLRPLWLDLGGIAKGFAVDRALAVLADFAPSQACVNAGGDIRICGAQSELVRLNPAQQHHPQRSSSPLSASELPVVELNNGALASSDASSAGPHLDGTTRQSTTARRFVSVWAPTCTVADGLTKVVMARGMAARDVLKHFDAHAVLHDATTEWSQVA